MILIDPRAGSGEFLEPVSKRVNGNAKHATLDSGDVAFSGWGPDGEVDVAIEIKTISDFLNSSRSGRFHEQLRRMSDSYQFIYLIIYGLYRPNDSGIIESFYGGAWSYLAPITMEARTAGKKRRAVYYYSELDKYLNSLELKRNVIVKRATSSLEVTWQIVNLYRWWTEKKWEEHDSTEGVKQQVGDIFRKASVCRMVAAQLPGIGWDKAGKVEKVFGSVGNLANADIEEIMTVPGVGKKLAQGVYDAIRRRE